MTQSALNQSLKVLLANTYALYLKTQNYHWNVVGANFHSLHLLFEAQYKDLADAVDGIAERLRAKSEYAPGSFQEFSSLKTVNEAKGKIDALVMIRDLAETHEQILKAMPPIMDQAKNDGDDVTQDLLIERMDFHEKTIWMLKAHLT